MIWVWLQSSNECELQHLITNISHHQWTCTTELILKVLFWIHQSFTLLFVDKHATLWAFMPDIICDVLNGWSCSSNWQPQTLFVILVCVHSRWSGTIQLTWNEQVMIISSSFLCFLCVAHKFSLSGKQKILTWTLTHKKDARTTTKKTLSRSLHTSTCTWIPSAFFMTDSPAALWDMMSLKPSSYTTRSSSTQSK